MSIEIKNLNYVYSQGTPFETKALDDINLKIETGEFIGLIGHTGSGKSTFIQHLNGLLKPTSGSIIIDGIDIASKEISMAEVRKKVGLVFQYPEYQLFEETIARDIAFGPKAMGLSDEEVVARVKESMLLTGLDYEKQKDKSPFEISGGQKRRVAIAGVLAMKPDILILDEPTAGLDPKGRDDILKEICNIHESHKNTIILVSHSMEDISKIADRLIVMNRGRVEFFDTPINVFKNHERLLEIGLDIPEMLKLCNKLRSNGFNINDDIFTAENAISEIIKNLNLKGVDND